MNVFEAYQRYGNTTSVIFRNISAEGAAFGEVEINQQNPWASLHQVRQNKLIVQAMVSGMEKFEMDGREEWALVFFFETPDEVIKGIIPKVASGFRTRAQMEQAVGQKLQFMIKEVNKETCILDRVTALEKMKGITLKEVKKGDVRTGVVKRVNPNNAAVTAVYRNVIAEGVAVGKVEILQENPWASLHQIRQHKLIVQAIVDDMEKFSFNDKEEWALIVYFKTPDVTIKGIIPKVLSGFNNRGEMKQVLKRQLAFMIKEVRRDDTCILDRVTALDKMRKITLKNVKKGDVLTGVVDHLNQYRAILNIGGIPSVLRLKDFSYKITKNLCEVLKIGDSLDVEVTNIREKATEEGVLPILDVCCGRQ